MWVSIHFDLSKHPNTFIHRLVGNKTLTWQGGKLESNPSIYQLQEDYPPYLSTAALCGDLFVQFVCLDKLILFFSLKLWNYKLTTRGKIPHTLTHRQTFAMNLISPASVVMQRFDATFQISEESLEKWLPCVQ